MRSKSFYRAIGIMSGTSLDGLDIACCTFIKRKNWEYKIESAATINYSTAWRKKLSAAHLLSGEDLLSLDAAYGNFMGKSCHEFIRKNRIRDIDLVASHGHTIFHQPGRFTFQLGSGASIHAASGIPVVYDFRSLDVALGGQGAPLVPLGDKLLFSEYDVRLNLGGIANLSMEKNHRQTAFDVAYANLGLNFLAQKTGKKFDLDGKLAARGKLDTTLLADLARVYQAAGRIKHALAREGFELHIIPLLDKGSIPLEDRMLTFCHSIASEIDRSLPGRGKKIRILATGGGALNPVLIRLIQEKLNDRALLVFPLRPTIEFKEALIFALLGVLRVRGEVNVLRSVTRASRDSCSGSFIV